MKDCADYVHSHYPGFGASAFVEDSILLGGSRTSINKLISLISNEPLQLQWGCQFTLDIGINNLELLYRLSTIGLKYIFFGLETTSDDVSKKMHKNIRSTSWATRSEYFIRELCSMGINVGIAVLFGLGESQTERIQLLDFVSYLRSTFSNLMAVSYNWAVRHPMRDPGNPYQYNKWGIDSPEFIELFKDFGEASVKYPLEGVAPPTLKELRELTNHVR
ncbi:hypothetical protein Enr17x_05000 [Gimesia fumaroli]|uniref:Radical SAM core domain-containing protein n=2 Tax=Gimesia fumaroli TaxID=2527976 RepID=A0A518I602_9PLAN|nr:hypothetical protein Enr17x_05000 [Gimesia fumaroli]